MKYHSKDQECAALIKKTQTNNIFTFLHRHPNLLDDSYFATKQNHNLHKQKNRQLVIKSYINTYLNYTEQMAAYSKSIK